MMGAKLEFFNYFRNLLHRCDIDRLLPVFTSGRGYKNFFVKCLPQNYQYKKWRAEKLAGMVYFMR